MTRGSWFLTRLLDAKAAQGSQQLSLTQCRPLRRVTNACPPQFV